MTLSPPVPVLDTTVLTPFDRIKAEVEIAESKATKTFGDYANPAINKAVRSYLYQLRQIRTSIDRTRKAQNDEAQSYIRSVNGFAKDLTDRVTKLIEPHDRIIKAIEEEEKERVETHERNLADIIDLKRLPAGSSSAFIQNAIDKLAEYDPTTFEEFQPKADAEVEITRTALETALQAAIDHEEAEAARERKREEERAAAQAKREEEIATAAAAKAKREAEEAAAAALEAERKAERRAREKAAAEAEAAIEAERTKAQAAERAAAKAAEREAVAVAEAKAAKTSEPVAAGKSPVSGPTKTQQRLLHQVILDAVLDNSPKDFATLLLRGEVFPAITIDWSKVQS